MYPFNCARNARRAAARQLTKRPRTRLILQCLEDRVTPATATLSAGVLTVDFTASGTTSETASIVRSASTISVAGKSFTADSVNKIVVQDSGGSNNQTIGISSASNATISLSGGLECTGVETVNIYARISATGTGAISINALENIDIGFFGGATLTTDSGDISLKANQQSPQTSSVGTGVVVQKTAITTVSGAIAIEGRGSSTSTGSGVYFADSTTINTATGPISIKGTGGIEGLGVFLCAKISTSNASISVVGVGKGTAIATNANGVYIQGILPSSKGELSAGGSGNVTIHGTAGLASGLGSVGVVLHGGKINTAGGEISVTGISGNELSEAISVQSSSAPSLISTNGNGNITLIADSLNINNWPEAIKAGSTGNAIVAIRPLTPGTKINVGGADVLGSSSPTLGLSNVELSRMIAGTIQIGDSASGAINVTADIARTTKAALTLTTGDSIGLAATLDSMGGDITLNSAGPITQTTGTIQTASGTLTLNAPGQTANFNSLGNKAAQLVIPVGVTALVNGSFDPSGFVQVDGLLGGSGSVGAVNVSATGTIAPGTSAAKLSTGNVVFASNSKFVVELNGPNAGTNHDQLAVLGTVNLGGATLQSSLGYTPSSGQVLKILDNDGTDDVTGTFNGYVEGATVSIGPHHFTISYKGGDGNDVTLTRQQMPPTVTSVVFGDGTNQRSLVNQIVVTFSEPVSFMGGVASAFTVRRSGSGGAIGDVTLTANPASGPASVVTITFSGSLTEFGSLVDGYYDLTINAAQVSGVGGALDGNGDFIPGGSYAVVGTTANRFYRLFGDSDGDGALSQGVDVIAFRNAFGSPSMILDFDGDGTVDQDDFVKFRNNFGGAP